MDPESTVDAREPPRPHDANRLALLRAGGPGQVVESEAGRASLRGRAEAPRGVEAPKRSSGRPRLSRAGVARIRGLPAGAAVLSALAGASGLPGTHVAALRLGLSRPAGLRLAVLRRAV